MVARYAAKILKSFNCNSSQSKERPKSATRSMHKTVLGIVFLVSPNEGLLIIQEILITKKQTYKQYKIV